jgi:hypothetical protein
VKKAIAIFLPQLLSSLPFLLPFVATSWCFNTTIEITNTTQVPTNSLPIIINSKE